MSAFRILEPLRRARTALALTAALAVGSATPVIVLKPSPAHAQTCAANKAGSCQAYQAKSVALTTTAGSVVTTTDPGEAKTGGASRSVCDITVADPTYCGSGVLTPPANGTASDDLSQGGLVTYAPNPGFVGTDVFVTQTGLLTDGQSRAWVVTTTYTVVVTAAAEAAPTVADASLTTAYDMSGSVALPSSGVVSGFSIAGGPAHGAATVSGASAVYTPDAGYSGADSFTFYATGPGGASNTATVSVTVAPPPAPTVAGAAIVAAYDAVGSTALATTGVVASLQVASSPAHGAATLSGATAVYTPDAGYIGTDSFTVTAAGPGGRSAPATVSVTVEPPAAPTATDGALTTSYDTPAAATLSGSGVISRFAIAGPPGHGTVALAGAVAAYTPSSGFIGADSFSFQALGPGGNSAPATIAVTVQPPPAPVAQSGAIACPYQTACTTTLTSTGLGSTYALASQAANGSCSLSGAMLTYVPAFGAVGPDRCTFTVSGPGGVSAPAVIYITNEPPPLPDPGGSTGAPVPAGASTAACAAGQAASIPGLPGPPTGTAYDPNWCDEQVLTIAQQALRLQNQQSQVAALQAQLALQQKMLQGLGSDAASPTLASVNAEAASILQQATGIGFNAQASGAAFAAAYPGGDAVAGFDGAQLIAALQAWQANTAQALQTSIAVQNQIAQSRARVAGAVRGAVDASNAAAGPTAAHQATNQILAAVSTQLSQLQDVLLAQSQAYAATAAARQQAGGAAAASAGETQRQVQPGLTSAPGVSDTRHM